MECSMDFPNYFYHEAYKAVDILFCFMNLLPKPHRAILSIFYVFFIYYPAIMLINMSPGEHFLNKANFGRAESFGKIKVKPFLINFSRFGKVVE